MCELRLERNHEESSSASQLCKALRFAAQILTANCNDGRWFFDRSATGVRRHGICSAVLPSDKVNIDFIGVGAQGLRVMLRFCVSRTCQVWLSATAINPARTIHSGTRTSSAILPANCSVQQRLGLARSRRVDSVDPFTASYERRCGSRTVPENCGGLSRHRVPQEFKEHPAALRPASRLLGLQ